MLSGAWFVTQAELQWVMQYLVVIEKGETGYGASVPDLPGCVAEGDTRDEVLRHIEEAIESHIQGLKAAGEPVPAPNAQGALVDVHAA